MFDLLLSCEEEITNYYNASSANKDSYLSVLEQLTNNKSKKKICSIFIVFMLDKRQHNDEAYRTNLFLRLLIKEKNHTSEDKQPELYRIFPADVTICSTKHI